MQRIEFAFQSLESLEAKAVPEEIKSFFNKDSSLRVLRESLFYGFRELKLRFQFEFLSS